VVETNSQDGDLAEKVQTPAEEKTTTTEEKQDQSTEKQKDTTSRKAQEQKKVEDDEDEEEESSDVEEGSSDEESMQKIVKDFYARIKPNGPEHYYVVVENTKQKNQKLTDEKTSIIKRHRGEKHIHLDSQHGGEKEHRQVSSSESVSGKLDQKNHQQHNHQTKDHTKDSWPPSPKDMYNFLDKYIVGQGNAKKVCSNEVLFF
jgi:hypothetical protein